MKVPAKHTAQFINGAAFKPTDWGDEGLPILRIAQLTGKEFDNFYDGYFDERYRVLDGDLLFAWSATIDSYIWTRGESVLNQHIFKVIPRDGVLKSFLFYALKHYSVIWADVDAHGSTMRHIKRESLSNKIYLPDLVTQKQIADFLDHETARIDQLIQKREAFLSLINERKASLTVKAIDGSILKGIGKGIDGWFGALPESWQVKRAKFLFRERQDRSKLGEEELLTVSHITGVTKRSDKDVNMFLAESMEGYKLVSEGDVVINTMWAWMGAMGVSPVKGLVSPSYGVYAPSGDAFEADYLDLLLRSRPFVAEATRRSKGIHSSRLRLYPDAFLDILLPVPSREAQRAILTALRVATEKEEQLATLSRLSLDRLREFRAALITAAVTGQIIHVTAWGKRGTSDRRLDAIETDIAAAPQLGRQEAARA